VVRSESPPRSPAAPARPGAGGPGPGPPPPRRRRRPAGAAVRVTVTPPAARPRRYGLGVRRGLRSRSCERGNRAKKSPRPGRVPVREEPQRGKAVPTGEITRRRKCSNMSTLAFVQNRGAPGPGARNCSRAIHVNAGIAARIIVFMEDLLGGPHAPILEVAACLQPSGTSKLWNAHAFACA